MIWVCYVSLFFCYSENNCFDKRCVGGLRGDSYMYHMQCDDMTRSVVSRSGAL